MQLDLNKVFHALMVERHRSFTLAANELELTQSALSRSIAALEERWGVKIFTRTRNGVLPTPLGSEFLIDARKLITDASAFDHNMTQRGKTQGTAFTFGLGIFVGQLMMADLTRHLSKSFPNLKISGTIATPDEMVQDVMFGSIDIAVFSEGGVTIEHNLSHEKICTVPYGFMSRKNHPLTKYEFVENDHLRNYPILESGFSPPPIELGPKIECKDHRVAVDIVKKSDTLWYCCPWLLREEISDGQLIMLPSEISSPKTIFSDISVYYSKGRSRSAAASAAIKRVKRNVGLLAIDPVVDFSLKS